MEINKLGYKLAEDFCMKANVYNDIKNGKFEGMLFYEDYIDSIEDAVGWMLETYGTEVFNVLDEWLHDGEEAWGFKLNDLKKKLNSCIKHQ